ncbi:FAD linked oxidase domain protein [Metarhizium album ARSEF 1941]|uniref:FAD linked oxidase domain protein n=1 Tax=Metarhizium album (strain ARSEF 1941) TaxID=1081103 RepID=A0A0B2WK82_METAS|nr:FAD linked oxidase domain protein [Metarhizium album ARSEF 1941]KHN94318.1 FAD linked oxidase domain protein [Metarhizium album ARSEF 1941]
MRGLLVCIASCAGLAAASPRLGRDLRACVAEVLGEGADGRVVGPEESTYTDARMGESIQFEQMPALIAYASRASQVAPLVRCARRSRVRAVPRAGGHHLVIDVTHIDYVRVSADKATARVGGGIRLGALYTALHHHGRDWPGGICPTVGLSGFLGAGGFNMQMRTLGLGVDHVVAAKVVLANGHLVDASARENSDLFWAVRGGGGGSYGIVVEWTLGLSQFPRSSMVRIRWDEPESRVDLATRFLEWAPRTDPAFMSSVNVYKNRTEVLGWCLGCALDHARALMNSSGLLAIGKPQVKISGGCNSVNARIFGYAVGDCIPDAEVSKYAPLAMNVLQQPFARVGKYPTFAWNETRQDPRAPQAQPWPRFRRMSKSFFMQKSKKLGREAVQSLVDRLTELPDEVSGWGEWHAWNISRKGEDQAAFAWRGEAYAHLEFILTGSEDAEKQKWLADWNNDLEGYLRPLTGPASYAGYMDADISTDPLQSYYGRNVNRLQLIKAKYDPSNFFDNPLGVVPGR